MPDARPVLRLVADPLDRHRASTPPRVERSPPTTERTRRVAHLGSRHRRERLAVGRDGDGRDSAFDRAEVRARSAVEPQEQPGHREHVRACTRTHPVGRATKRRRRREGSRRLSRLRRTSREARNGGLAFDRRRTTSQRADDRVSPGPADAGVSHAERGDGHDSQPRRALPRRRPSVRFFISTSSSLARAGMTRAPTVSARPESDPKRRQTRPKLGRWTVASPMERRPVCARCDSASSVRLEATAGRPRRRSRIPQAARGARSAAAARESGRSDRAADRRALGRDAARDGTRRRCRSTSRACARRSATGDATLRTKVAGLRAGGRAGSARPRPLRAAP